MNNKYKYKSKNKNLWNSINILLISISHSIFKISYWFININLYIKTELISSIRDLCIQYINRTGSISIGLET